MPLPAVAGPGAPRGGGLLHGLGPAAIRFLEPHEATAHAHGRRRVVDLGDAILLHAPDDGDPFLNRLSGVRLATQPAAFERRLAELLTLFAGLDRRPHVW